MMTVPSIQTDVNIGMVAIDTEDYAIRLTDSSTTSATVTLTNRTGTDSTFLYVIAAYRANGKMVAFCMDKVSLSASENAILTVSFAESDLVAEVKAFVLCPDSYAPLRSTWGCPL